MMCGSAQTGPARAAQLLPPLQRRAIETGGQLHLYFQGISAEDVAAILDRQALDERD
jgi:hypothetical protein